MKRWFLEFERPVVELEEKIAELRRSHDGSAVDLSREIEALEKKARKLLEDIYRKLDAWQTTQVARHPLRPYTLDYVAALFTDFVELHGDRHVADDKAIVAGLARFVGRWPALCGDRASERARYQREDRAQFRDAPARGLPQGGAGDAAGGEVRVAGVFLRRYTGRLPGDRCRGAQPV